jgi:hypothetical protein
VATSLLPSTCCYGTCGLYTDQVSSNIVIENNVVYHLHGGYVHHFGRYNAVRNNIFAPRKSAQVMFTGPEDHLSFRGRASTPMRAFSEFQEESCS